MTTHTPLTPADCNYIPLVDTSSLEVDKITVDVVTEGHVGGNGIYDVFMKAHMDAIQQEFAKQRIRGPEYSQVYLGGMQTAMQSAVAFALGKDKASWEAEILKLGAIKAQAEIALAGKQLCKVEEEIKLLRLQQAMSAAQAWAEIAKTDEGISTQMNKMLEKGNFQGPAGPSDESIIKESVNKTKEDILKVTSEINFIKQKIVTEAAQTSDNRLKLDGSLSNDTVRGIIGKNKNVLQRQADGFIKDAQAKIAKIAADAYIAQFSTMDGDLGNSNPSGTTQKTVFNTKQLWGYMEMAGENTSLAEHTSSDIDPHHGKVERKDKDDIEAKADDENDNQYLPPKNPPEPEEV